MTEAELRQWDARHRLTRAGLLLWAHREELRYWPVAAPLSPDVVDLDVAGECAAVAIEVASRFGGPVLFGWVASTAHAVPVAHCWNLNADGEVIDAAQARRQATGYLGVALTQREVAWLSVANRF